MMDLQDVQVFQLGVREQFQRLTDQEKRYAHHMARAAWHGTRIILRQVSPESASIFDFIIELHNYCAGNWSSLTGPDVNEENLQGFLVYAATFLSNIGNYFGSGDQKFVPAVDGLVLKSLASRSSRLSELYKQIAESIYARPPFSLGYPAESTQSSYYPDSPSITEEEIKAASKALEQNSVFLENTRLRKAANNVDYELLVASSFRTGDLEAYRESQRIWVRDCAPRVENIMGFVEPYRDPHGVRAEFESLVAIADDGETAMLAKLVELSPRFIRRLPWATEDNDGKGPFEKSLFEPPDFSSIHSLAYCSSIIFPGINLPNYNDIRQEVGFKNVIIANRMAAESQCKQYPFIPVSEAERFKEHKFPAYYWWVVLHELLGHGTGRMMVQKGEGQFNFDIENPPVNPLSGKPITSWYKPGQTWTGQFADLATTVDECRAELVGAYLMDEKELLGLLGFTDTSDIRAEDLTYNLYQQLGVDGLRGLSNFNVGSGKWGQAHSRAHFSILRCLLLDGDGVVTITHDKPKSSLTVHVDRSKIVTHGKPALGRMLLRLHMYRCTADVAACRTYYEDLSRVEGEHLEWRETVLANKPPPMVFVQANTFLEESSGEVVLKEYDATVEGIIQSWAERRV
ncbi:dipeptidyl-peptidase 3 [Pyricularia oryzae Y34]|uniref:Dipeptidyl-peptidase 3 n=2 Tax=Pyricularia oryzae TaxID=318829 RepID=A0AA97P6Q8_PYRO3|nr:dipeptidyl-peptidase 3 [Pyricularia oryzae Y34]